MGLGSEFWGVVYLGLGIGSWGAAGLRLGLVFWNVAWSETNKKTRYNLEYDDNYNKQTSNQRRIETKRLFSPGEDDEADQGPGQSK